jgi:hypothetical protein
MQDAGCRELGTITKRKCLKDALRPLWFAYPGADKTPIAHVAGGFYPAPRIPPPASCLATQRGNSTALILRNKKSVVGSCP